MKKRYIIFNTLILICSLFIFLIVSLVSITQINKRNMEGEIKNYLRIVENGYDGTNMEYCKPFYMQFNYGELWIVQL